MIGIHIVEPGVEFITPKHLPNWAEVAQAIIEDCGRTCYQSESKEGDTPEAFIERHRKHESIIEHFGFTVRFTCSRACSHQLVRHRLASYSQESQRFCDYAKDRLSQVHETEGKFLQVIMPPKIIKSTCLNGHLVSFDTVLEVDGIPMDEWLDVNYVGEALTKELFNNAYDWCMQKIDCYGSYLSWRERKIPSEDARFDLPNASKTTVATTYNFRIWRHVLGHPVFGRALNKKAQWEIKGITLPVLEYFREHIPSMFGDI